jgi:hypothetical protein
MGAFVLVHSPVTGPSTWRWAADELTARGHRVVVPPVPPAATALGWPAFVGAVGALAAGLDSPVLVGHSGAGPLLPRIGTRVNARALVFVDADVPPEAGDTTLVPGEFLEFLRGLANNGVLPPWSEWFGPDTMRELISDDQTREIVSAELPAVPLSYFEARMAVPAGWMNAHCGYVLLSEAYANQATQAAAKGWPVARLPGAHLDIVTRPAAIADAILAVAGEPGASVSGTGKPAAGKRVAAEPAGGGTGEPAAGEPAGGGTGEPAAREPAGGDPVGRTRRRRAGRRAAGWLRSAQ